MWCGLQGDEMFHYQPPKYAFLLGHCFPLQNPKPNMHLGGFCFPYLKCSKAAEGRLLLFVKHPIFVTPRISYKRILILINQNIFISGSRVFFNKIPKRVRDDRFLLNLIFLSNLCNLFIIFTL